MDKFPIPYVLECMRFVSPSPDENRRTIRDYEFDLYLSGERDIYLDGEHHHIAPDCLVFRKPGQEVVGYGGYDMFMLTLDFSNPAPENVRNYLRMSRSPEQKKCELDILESIPTVFVPVHHKELKSLYEKLSQCSHPNIVDLKQQREYIAEFLFLVFADAYRYNREQEQKSDNRSYVKKACTYIHNNYSQPLTVEEIAEKLSINPNYLIRLFKSEINTTPTQYILETRLVRARYQLLQTDASVQDIALSTGFANTSYFIKRFKERFGKSPLKYRKENAE